MPTAPDPLNPAARGTGLPPGVSAQDANRTEDTTSAEPTPGMGSQTGRQSLYFGANLPGMLGAAGILITNPQSLGACGISGVGYAPGSGIPGWLGGPALLGQGFTGGLTPADLSGSVYGFSSILPGYGSTAPGTYLTYRLMRNNPTVAIARLAATAPIRAADITVDGPDATDEQVEFIESIILPLWPAFVRDALFALDYGWKGFEKVYATSGGGGYTVLQRLKPLGVDITMIRWDEATGQMAGLEQQDAKLGPEKCFVWTYDQEDDAYYGRSRHENIRAVWWAWMELLRKEGQYLSKVAGVTPVMKYPEGTGRDATGTVRPNFELAQQALYMLGRGNGIAMPNRLADWAQDMIRAGIDVSQLASWQIQFLEPKGEHGQDFITQMQHKESLMLRGWLVPERAVAEGKYGTKAEAETHTDLAVAIAQHDLFDLLRCVNERIIDPLLALNFGPEARGLVTVNASPLIDDKAVLARNIVEAVLNGPNSAGLVTKVLNFDAMLEQQGLPVTGVSAQEAVSDATGTSATPGPQMTRTRVFCGIRSPDHNPAPGSLSSPTTDAQIADLARRLLDYREMTRRGTFRGSGRGHGCSRSRSRVYPVTPWRRSGTTRLDLAGFDPNQARDQRGRWTDEGDHRGALEDQIKGKLQDVLDQVLAHPATDGHVINSDAPLAGPVAPQQNGILEQAATATQPSSKGQGSSESLQVTGVAQAAPQKRVVIPYITDEQLTRLLQTNKDLDEQWSETWLAFDLAFAGTRYNPGTTHDPALAKQLDATLRSAIILNWARMHKLEDERAANNDTDDNDISAQNLAALNVINRRILESLKLLNEDDIYRKMVQYRALEFIMTTLPGGKSAKAINEGRYGKAALWFIADVALWIAFAKAVEYFDPWGPSGGGGVSPDEPATPGSEPREPDVPSGGEPKGPDAGTGSPDGVSDTKPQKPPGGKGGEDGPAPSEKPPGVKGGQEKIASGDEPSTAGGQGNGGAAKEPDARGGGPGRPPDANPRQPPSGNGGDDGLASPDKPPTTTGQTQAGGVKEPGPTVTGGSSDSPAPGKIAKSNTKPGSGIGESSEPDGSGGRSPPDEGKPPTSPGGSEWVKPPRHQLPTNGTWDGVPGNSNFKPKNPAELGLKPDEMIPFRNGEADFSKWSQGNFISDEPLTGDPVADRAKMIRTIAKQKGWTNAQVNEWLKTKELALHHVGGDKFQSIPWRLHGNRVAIPPMPGVSHMGAASKLRKQ